MRGSNSTSLDDNSIMTVGKAHVGKQMQDVPDNYLKWFYGENKVNFKVGKVSRETANTMAYIEESFNESELA